MESSGAVNYSVVAGAANELRAMQDRTPGTVLMAVRVPAAVAASISEIAQGMGSNKSVFMRQALAEFLEKLAAENAENAQHETV